MSANKLGRSLSSGALLLFVVAGCHSRPTVEKPHANTVAAERQPVASGRVVAPGIVEPWGDSVRLALEVQGLIAEVAVHDGDSVERGDVLVRLDDSLELQAVEVARAEVAEAEALVHRVHRGSTREELLLADAERQLAREVARQKERDAARASSLSETGAAAIAEAERAGSDAAASKLSADASEARARLVERGPRSEERQAARARLAAAKARLAAADVALAKRRLVAPKALKVLWSRWNVGELYTPGAPPLVIAGDVSRLQVRTEVDELDAPRIKTGMAGALYTDDGARAGEGRVVQISPSYGRRGLATEAPTSRTDVRVREVFVETGGSGALAPGQRVWVHL